MAAEKREYDASLGGKVHLGNHVATYRYAASAVNEIKRLLAQIQKPQNTKLVFQTLPKHMRRRAMSHHPKRLPRKYRVAHKMQMAKAGKPQLSKRPSRKYRRRPRNLLREYERRQRNNVWLETHIWHARRFHMVNRWGYRLPYASCSKTYRACYRASAQHCLLQDISFYVCLELKGPLAVLKAGLPHLCNPHSDLSIFARTYMTGRREGSIEIFRHSKYPYGALGEVTFLWKPEQENTDADPTLWLWMHPCAYTVILEELIKLFDLQKAIEAINTDTATTEKPAIQPIRRYQNAANAVVLSDLKYKLNRLRLTGPRSFCVLKRAFKVKRFEDIAEQNKQNWYSSFGTEQECLDSIHAAQADYWNTANECFTAAQFLSNSVVGLNIEDPRLHRPKKRTPAKVKVTPNLNESNHMVLALEKSSKLPVSALWHEALRQRVTQEMVTQQKYCQLRQKHAVVPGQPCKFENALQPVPLLIIQRPGCAYGSGFDVIAPQGYAMPIWLSLIMWGARPGGLRETDTLNREMGRDQHAPDTIAGLQAAAERYTELRTKYFRLPPNKRCNYNKIAIVSPFRVPFKQLLQDWWQPEEEPNETTVPPGFFVLRDKQLLHQVKCCGNSELPIQVPNCLIAVQLRMKRRGNPGEFAILCLPTAADLKRNLKNIKFARNQPAHLEPTHTDDKQKERKLLRSEHKKLLKRLRARRVREKRQKQKTADSFVRIRAANTATIVDAHFKRMCSLWLRDEPHLHANKKFSVRHQCSREVFGYLTAGNFSMLQGTVCGVGYVAATGLRVLHNLMEKANMKELVCLVRDANSANYFFATVKYTTK